MPSKTIRSMVADISNPDADNGGLWLPNIQRFFVWNESQMERLFDSIMRQYPLPSMLIWKTRDDVRNREFIKHFYPGYNIAPLYRPTTSRTKRLVLDGQQRLQTLFIGLKGSMENRVLHFDVTSGQPSDADEIKYKFKFLDPKKAKWPWVTFGEKIVYDNRLAGEITQAIVEKESLAPDAESIRLATRNIERAKREFGMAETLIYHEINSTEEDSEYTFDDVVEIFIRANDGGTKLSKSDLMFSLITADWSTADVEMGEFLSEINGEQFSFDRDFVLKCSMVILNHGAKYDVEKLRTEVVRKQITESWASITQSIRFVRDFLVNKTFVKCDKALPSYLALIPLIYFKHHFPDRWESANSKVDYLLRVLLSGAFSGRPDNLIDKVVGTIRKSENFAVKEIYEVIREDGRHLNVSENQLFDMGYGSRTIHLLFNIWYPQSNYSPAWDGHLPQVDHIFPRSILKSLKVPDPTNSQKTAQRYSASQINQLANCMLLTASENGAAGKSDTEPKEWFKNKDDSYFELHCIPRDQTLWEIDQYEKFIEVRKLLIKERFASMLFSQSLEGESP